MDKLNVSKKYKLRILLITVFAFAMFKVYSQESNEYFKLGVVLYEQSKYSLAIDEFSNSIKNYPNYADAYKYRAYSYEKINDINRATKDLNFFVKLRPYNYDSYIVRAQFFMRIGEDAQALLDFNKALMLNPDYTFGYLYRATCYKNLGDTNNSIKDFLKVESVYPNHIKVIEELAYLYFYTDEPILSVRYCDKLIELKPEDPNIYFIRGKANLQLKKYKESCKDFEKAISLGNTRAVEFMKDCP